MTFSSRFFFSQHCLKSQQQGKLKLENLSNLVHLLHAPRPVFVEDLVVTVASVCIGKV